MARREEYATPDAAAQIYTSRGYSSRVTLRQSRGFMVPLVLHLLVRLLAVLLEESALLLILHLDELVLDASETLLHNAMSSCSW